MSWQYLNHKHGVKARKAHRCGLCCEPIAIGEKYDRRTGVNDDGICTMRMHPECNEASIDWDAGDWETFMPGDFDRPAKPPLDGTE